MPTNCPPRPRTELAGETVCDRLRSVETLTDLDERDLQLIAAASRSVTAKAGHELMREHSGDGFVVVLSGTVEVIRICERVAIVTEGGVVGELAALGCGQRNATLLAGTDVEAVHISGPAFASLLDELPDVERRLQPLISAGFTG